MTQSASATAASQECFARQTWADDLPQDLELDVAVAEVCPLKLAAEAVDFADLLELDVDDLDLDLPDLDAANPPPPCAAGPVLLPAALPVGKPALAAWPPPPQQAACQLAPLPAAYGMGFAYVDGQYLEDSEEEWEEALCLPQAHFACATASGAPLEAEASLATQAYDHSDDSSDDVADTPSPDSCAGLANLQASVSGSEPSDDSDRDDEEAESDVDVGDAVDDDEDAEDDEVDVKPPAKQLPKQVAARHVDSGDEAGGPRRKLCLTMEYLNENGFFDMKAKEAARRLGIGITTLKRYCRDDLGISRWPWRQRTAVGAMLKPRTSTKARKGPRSRRGGRRN